MCLCGCSAHHHEKTKGELGTKQHEKSKVYCSLCEYWRFRTKPCRTVNDRCFHPNIREKEKWTEPTAIREGFWFEWTISGDCWKINANNDCELFKKGKFPNRG